MDFVVVGDGEHLKIFVRIALAVPHVAKHHSQDGHISGGFLALGVRVRRARESVRDTHHLADLAK